MAKIKFKFKCEKCGKEFRTQGGLAWHLDHIHRDAKVLEEIARLRESVHMSFLLALAKNVLSGDEQLKVIQLIQSSNKTALTGLIHFLTQKSTGRA